MPAVENRKSHLDLVILSPAGAHSFPSLSPEWISTRNELKSLLASKTIEVLVIPTEELVKPEILEICAQYKIKNKSFQVVVINSDSREFSNLLKIYQKLQIFRVLSNFDFNANEAQIMEAIEQARLQKQNSQLADLISSHTQSLNSLYKELEDRTVIRKTELEESLRKTSLAHQRWHTLQDAFLTISKCESASEIERTLTVVLHGALHVRQIKIDFKPHDDFIAQKLKKESTYAVFRSRFEAGSSSAGSVFFFREESFSKEETDFLNRISEGIALVIDRLHSLEESETLREQWQATFNAVQDPVLLIDENYNVSQMNSAAQSRHPNGKKSKCYQVLFDRSSPCVNCQRGQDFRVENKNEIINVSSQKIDSYYFHIYHDISEQTRMERKILESARFAELGTIGSSIAHELNNPLGGILSFVQLIRMDLKPDNPIYPDIVEMENGVKRCRDIIENLLGFSRTPEHEKMLPIDLAEVVKRVVAILELQTKTQSVEIRIKKKNKNYNVLGNFNLLTQAVTHLLQLSLDSFRQKKEEQSDFHGLIELELLEDSQETHITILDNGPGSGRRNSIQYSIATQIIHEHAGRLEISGPPKQVTMAKFSLPRLAL